VKKPHSGGKKSGPGGDDDHDVWRHTAASIEPLKRAKGRVHPAVDSVKSGGPKPKSSGNERAAGKENKAVSRVETPTPKPSRSTPPELSPFDRNSARKIRGGRAEIEARVDLHGMRQHEAHAALRRFLVSCQGRGLRYVLIITGKGKAMGPAADHIGEADRERGVLKRNVPRWLEEPDLRALVVSFTTAAIQHGGEGAIYVHLRSKNRV
jgi:DNA-nicking Smr family endonuclease